MKKVKKVTAIALTSIDKYTGPLPTVSRIFLIIPSVPKGINSVTDITKYHEVRASGLFTKSVYFSSFNPLETDVVIIVVIVWAR
jgi:hypothetical protein